MKKQQEKVARVMREFKKGELKSSSGQKVTNPKQAIAIGLSEAGVSKKSKGGEMKESKAMMKKEVSFMKKKGAPKSMIKHEMKEAGMKSGGKVKKMAMGGASMMPPPQTMPRQAPQPTMPRTGPQPTMPRQPMPSTNVKPANPSIRTTSLKDNPMVKMAAKSMGMKSGGLSAGHKAADGIATKGKTKAKQVTMAGSKKMKKGGYC